MPTPTKYTYSVAADFPGGAVWIPTLVEEIQASAIVTAFDHIDLAGDVIDIWFKDPLSAGDETILDGDVVAPAGGLIAAHVNTTVALGTPVEVNNTPRVHHEKISQDDGVERVYVFSPNWCDKTTWYGEAIEVLAEAVGTGDGAQTVFPLAQNDVIDLTHGKVAEEGSIPLPAGATMTSWQPVIKVDGVTQTEAVPFGGAANDYSINYATGDITFVVAPANTLAVTADYFYADTAAGNSKFKFGPPAGKKWTIEIGETQFAKDLVLNDTVIFVPILLASDTTEVGPRSNYKTLGTYMDYTTGSYPIVPAFGGSERGLTQDTIILRWDYQASMVLKSSQGVGIKVFLENDVAFGGERATFTLYIKEEDE
jgi:hypothetical protein